MRPALATLLLATPFAAVAAEPDPKAHADLFNLPLAESHPLRVAQAGKLDAYIRARKDDRLSSPQSG
jgi:hypothetical protein